MILQNGIEITSFNHGVTVDLAEYTGSEAELKQLMGEIDAILDKGGMRTKSPVSGIITKRGMNIMEQKRVLSYIYECDDQKQTKKAYQALIRKISAGGK